jgi:hypothetical protein
MPELNSGVQNVFSKRAGGYIQFPSTATTEQINNYINYKYPLVADEPEERGAVADLGMAFAGSLVRSSVGAVEGGLKYLAEDKDSLLYNLGGATGA